MPLAHLGASELGQFVGMMKFRSCQPFVHMLDGIPQRLILVTETSRPTGRKPTPLSGFSFQATLANSANGPSLFMAIGLQAMIKWCKRLRLNGPGIRILWITAYL
jgi:hypothetical protein